MLCLGSRQPSWQHTCTAAHSAASACAADAGAACRSAQASMSAASANASAMAAMLKLPDPISRPGSCSAAGRAEHSPSASGHPLPSMLGWLCNGAITYRHEKQACSAPLSACEHGNTGVHRGETVLRTDLGVLDGEKLGPAALLPSCVLVHNAAQPHRHRLLGVPAAKRALLHAG